MSRGNRDSLGRLGTAYEDHSVPIYEFWFQATGSGAAATTFMASMTAAAFIASIGSVQSSSRLTWSFARDDAMIFSSYIKLSSEKFGCPVWALLFNAFWLFVLGCVYLVSSSGRFLSLFANSHRLSAPPAQPRRKISLTLILSSIQCLHWHRYGHRTHILRFPGFPANVSIS